MQLGLSFDLQLGPRDSTQAVVPVCSATVGV